MPLTMKLISEAIEFLGGQIRETPVEESPALTKVMGVPTWLKLENLQLTGSFKIRGALFRLAHLSSEAKASGIITCSAGNHGKAVAYAGQLLDIPVTIYVPGSVDEVKYRDMVAMGARVVRSEFPGYDETETWALEAAAQAGLPFISAFDDAGVMAGNGGSLAVEVHKAIPEAKNFIIPVSGGGLGAGFSLYIKELVPEARLIACQHLDSPGLALSLERGTAITRLPPIETVAGGIEGGIGPNTFPILKDRVDQVALVSEAEIFQGVRWTLDQHQYLIEPSAAATVAACIRGNLQLAEGPAVVVLSGRNVSLETLQRILRESS